MGGCTGRYHARKITGRNGVGGGTAESLALIFTFDSGFRKRQTAGAHGAVFTAGALDPDVTGFHGDGPIKDGFDTQLLSTQNHLLTGRVSCGRDRISNFFKLWRDLSLDFSWFWHKWFLPNNYDLIMHL
jgi:hypothetical protein